MLLSFDTFQIKQQPQVPCDDIPELCKAVPYKPVYFRESTTFLHNMHTLLFRRKWQLTDPSLRVVPPLINSHSAHIGDPVSPHFVHDRIIVHMDAESLRPQYIHVCHYIPSAFSSSIIQQLFFPLLPVLTRNMLLPHHILLGLYRHLQSRL